MKTKPTVYRLLAGWTWYPWKNCIPPWIERRRLNRENSPTNDHNTLRTCR